VQDERYKTNADRHANRATLIPEVAEIMRGETSATWVGRLEKAGVPCSAINDMAGMRAHPQTEALGMVRPVPEIDLALMSLPLSLDGVRPSIRTRAPRLGEHNAVLGAAREVDEP
jgi:formyl-CoA transferase